MICFGDFALIAVLQGEPLQTRSRRKTGRQVKRRFFEVLNTVFWFGVIYSAWFTYKGNWQVAIVACLWAILAAVVAAGLGVEGRLDQLRVAVETKLDEILDAIPKGSASELSPAEAATPPH
jgi:hypothetical protein